MNTKTIGPLVLAVDGSWDFIVRGCYQSHLCGNALKKRFNIPATATRIWVSLTKRNPKHGDAIRVRTGRYGLIQLDDEAEINHQAITSRMLNEAADFGNDFYATIHYT